jgi:hypothetical protein
MGSGVDPHLYKASEGDIQKLSQAQIIFYNGRHLEGRMGDILVKMARQKPTVAVTEQFPAESVGSILVVAMLIVPPATAYLLTEKLHVMLVLSVLIGAVASVSGYFLARSIDGSITAAMTTVAGALFLLAFLFALQQGLVSCWLARRQVAAQAVL